LRVERRSDHATTFLTPSTVGRRRQPPGQRRPRSRRRHVSVMSITAVSTPHVGVVHVIVTKPRKSRPAARSRRR